MCPEVNVTGVKACSILTRKPEEETGKSVAEHNKVRVKYMWSFFLPINDRAILLSAPYRPG